MPSVSTVKPAVHYDPACLLNPGDHAFIRTQSFVAYNFSRITSVKLLQEKVASGEFVFLGMLDEQAHNKVREGLLKSRFVSPAHQQFFLESEI